MANVKDVKSNESFQSLLSEDLTRVSLINFWAPWAEPCAKMNEVVVELAKQYPNVLVLQVEAEEQEDIAESFSVESVPAFVLLRGHTLLDRVSGADASTLTTLVAKHAATRTLTQPLSHTDKSPAPPPVSVAVMEEKPETQDELEKRMRGLMTKSKTVLFMKGSPDAPRCGFSRKTVTILRDEGVEFTHFDILTDESVRAGLKVLNNWPTFPQLIINGEFVGGLDIIQEMVDNGELKELLE